jgi:hypothetical protein
MIRGILALALADEGYAVFTAEDGEQALAIASTLDGQVGPCRDRHPAARVERLEEHPEGATALPGYVWLDTPPGRCCMLRQHAWSSGRMLRTDRPEPVSSTEVPMPQYVIERDLPRAGKLSPAELKAISQKSLGVLSQMGTQIQWVHSYVTGDKIYCVYRAPNKEMLREHARQGGFPRGPRIGGHVRDRPHDRGIE